MFSFLEFGGADKQKDSIGALLAVADWRSRTHLANSTVNSNEKPITIRLLLTSIIKSYEIQGIYQERNAFNEFGLDHSLLTKLAATASLSLLLDLTHGQTCAAVSQVWTDSSPLRLFRQSPNTGPRKGWAAGDACQRAVHLTLLTKEGQPGYPTALTDPEWGFLRHHYGSLSLITRSFATSVIDNRFVKLVAAEGHGISAVEAALTLSHTLREMGITNPAEAIDKIKIRTMAAAMMIINKAGPLRNAADRDHCMRFMVALTLIKGGWPQAADYEDFSRYASSSDIETLRGKVEIVEDLQLTADYHDREKRTGSSGVTVTLKGGKAGKEGNVMEGEVLEEGEGKVLEEVLVEYPIGHPWCEGTEGALREKTIGNLRLSLSEGVVREIMDVVEGEGFGEGDVAGFVDLFWKGSVAGVEGGLTGVEEVGESIVAEKKVNGGGLWESCAVI